MPTRARRCAYTRLSLEITLIERRVVKTNELRQLRIDVLPRKGMRLQLAVLMEPLLQRACVVHVGRVGELVDSHGELRMAEKHVEPEPIGPERGCDLLGEGGQHWQLRPHHRHELLAANVVHGGRSPISSARLGPDEGGVAWRCGEAVARAAVEQPAVEYSDVEGAVVRNGDLLDDEAGEPPEHDVRLHLDQRVRSVGAFGGGRAEVPLLQ
mmetsp:Transcript_14167/g.32340  ORF Transcript_14167/g.32340 Transcript_14167/m.32340 type:complete len:211 (-) Transcript_14167:771-1403(-)